MNNQNHRNPQQQNYADNYNNYHQNTYPKYYNNMPNNQQFNSNIFFEKRLIELIKFLLNALTIY